MKQNYSKSGISVGLLVMLALLFDARIASADAMESKSCMVYFSHASEELNQVEAVSHVFLTKGYTIVEHPEDADFEASLYGGRNQMTSIQQIQDDMGWFFGKGLIRLAHWGEDTFVRNSVFSFRFHHVPSETLLAAYFGVATRSRFYKKVSNKIDSYIPDCKVSGQRND